MKFYRVSYSVDGGNSGGFSWHTSKRESQARAKEAIENDPQEYKVSEPPRIEEVEIVPTKKGILAALKRYAEHEANG